MFEFILQSIFYLFTNKTLAGLNSNFQIPFVGELLFWIPMLLLAAVFCFWSPAWLDRVESGFRRLARRRIASVAGVGLLALLLRALLLPWIPIPVPASHDEYSYLFQARTFDSGRLTNPPHPMWVHFETIHINMQPTYHSMYPPGQAMFLLAGMRVFGHPWFGVWLSMVLMCAATCWMLQGWMPPQWALLGGLLAVFRFALFGNWINSYYGGAVAALGGALVLGALPRIQRLHNQAQSNIGAMAVLFALGLVILANTRPYEGLCFCLVSAGCLMAWFLKKRRERAPIFRKVLAVCLLIGMPSAAAMMYYNWRCTGRPLRMPYLVNQETYHVTRPFLWQKRYAIPAYRHQEMRRMYVFFEYPDYLNLHSKGGGGLADLLQSKFRFYYSFFLWPFFLAVFPAAWVAARSRRLRPLVMTAVVLLAALALQLWKPQGHYAAPGACVLMALLVTAIRVARTMRFRRWPIGLALSRAMAASMFGLLIYATAYTAINPFDLVRAEFPPHKDLERERVMADLNRMPGKQLVFVHTSERGSAHNDWIYNEPDIDHAKVVWADDMGPAMNRELIAYFPDRNALIVYKDEPITHVLPYRDRVGW